MRDRETISLALTAAETGHLVFGTLHTSSAPKTIDRIIDVFPAGRETDGAFDAVRIAAGGHRAGAAQEERRRPDGGRMKSWSASRPSAI
jgi:twitching motility protein PilT